ncbi:hypothetical protein HGM15179_020424 [Zosterops borbonicus]|uniref:Uncharacterized protein n=1 Tax=Zosterops borbonicus TaxID=364589 RepID=A0A8K1FYF7_9PASS|nr:hypothetical protein HGM15179_020424 [Zosterops borbonicus]
MDATEGPTKHTKLQIAVTPDMLTLQQPSKPSPILDSLAFTSDSEVKDVWFTYASPKCIDGDAEIHLQPVEEKTHARTGRCLEEAVIQWETLGEMGSTPKLEQPVLEGLRSVEE